MDIATLKRYMIHQEQLLVVSEHSEIITILGSCVGVVLLDLTASVAGLNHYVLPLWDGVGLPSPKYGNVSMEKLIEEMQRNGAKLDHIQAKVFGGSSMNISERFGVGERNIQIALDILNDYKIPVIAKDIAGNRGRKLILDSKTGEVKVFYSGGENCR
jgi:chemotaxis protein CheD